MKIRSRCPGQSDSLRRDVNCYLQQEMLCLLGACRENVGCHIKWTKGSGAGSKSRHIWSRVDWWQALIIYIRSSMLDLQLISTQSNSIEAILHLWLQQIYFSACSVCPADSYHEQQICGDHWGIYWMDSFRWMAIIFSKSWSAYHCCNAP